jgi:hypothetical protein
MSHGGGTARRPLPGRMKPSNGRGGCCHRPAPRSRVRSACSRMSLMPRYMAVRCHNRRPRHWRHGRPGDDYKLKVNSALSRLFPSGKPIREGLRESYIRGMNVRRSRLANLSIEQRFRVVVLSPVQKSVCRFGQRGCRRKPLIRLGGLFHICTTTVGDPGRGGSWRTTKSRKPSGILTRADAGCRTTNSAKYEALGERARSSWCNGKGGRVVPGMTGRPACSCRRNG